MERGLGLAAGIRVELTATERVGLQRYSFPASDAAHVVLDLAHMVGGEGGSILDSELRVVDDTTIEGGRRVSRWAKDRHVYSVQSATLGGNPLTHAWLRHEELLAAGEIAFVMGPEPNRAWGASEAERPPSMSDPRD